VNDNLPDSVHWPPVVYDDAVFDAEPELEQGADEAAAHERGWWPSGFAEWFAIGFTFLPALLYVPGSQPYRLIIRVAAYAVSLVAFAMWWFDRGGRKATRHPAERWLGFIAVWLAMGLANPGTPSFVAGVAQVTVNFAIFSPLFWVPGYVTRRHQLLRVLAVILVCNGVNSAVGVLQVYDPDRWMPKQLSANFTGPGGQDALAASTYVGPNGRPIVRPPGLFDTPGAVCSAGTLAAMLGLIFFVEPLSWWRRLLSLGLAVLGMAAIYLSHVRSSFVVTLAMMAFYIALVTAQRQRKRAAGFVTLAVGTVAVALSVATVLGGQSVQERFMTLLADDPRTTYYESRGIQVEHAFSTLVEKYPFGAGLARWGMVSIYFGNDDSGAIDQDILFAEVQPSAWILDGGWPLLLMYSLALLVTVAFDLRLVQSLVDPVDRLLAAIVVATNFGTLAFVFTFVPFGTAAGMQFWFLEGALHGAMSGRPRR